MDKEIFTNVNSILDQKKLLREKFLKLRMSISNEEKTRKSNIICNFLINKDFFINYNVIALYSSISNEVSLDKIFHFLLEDQKKTILFPKVYSMDLRFFQVRDKNNLSLGKFGILEPKTYKEFDAKEIDLFLIPGLVFDKKCERIGYGYGCFDRFLANRRKDSTVLGVSYKFQVVDEIKTTPSDIQMNNVITEDGFIH